VRIHTDFSSVEQRMAFVIHLAAQNVKQQTGGPFGAAIFDKDTQQLLSVGMNLVVAHHNSTHHAEMIAIMLAQQTLRTFNVSEHGNFELVTSCEPCAMCFGALPWSGIRHVVCGATSADAERIGFDEGEKHPCWQQALEKRGITVQREVLRAQAALVLQNYSALKQIVY